VFVLKEFLFLFCFSSSPGESSSFSLGLHFILVFVRVFFLARRCVRWFIAYFSSLFLDALCLSVTVLIFYEGLLAVVECRNEQTKEGLFEWREFLSGIEALSAGKQNSFHGPVGRNKDR
jgi:hypothetical protein